jgi:hypothetical protein
MKKDDWIMLAYAVTMGLLAAVAVWSVMQPQPAQQWTMKVEYTPPKQVQP